MADADNLEELERLLAKANSRDLHPEDVASARFQLKNIVHDGRLAFLIATAREVEGLRAEVARLRSVLKWRPARYDYDGQCSYDDAVRNWELQARAALEGKEPRP